MSLFSFFGSTKFIKVLRFLWPYLWGKNTQYKGRFIAAFSLVIIYMGLNLLLPWILKEIISIFLQKQINIVAVYSFILLYGILFTFNHVSMSLRHLLMNRVVERAVYMLSYNLLNHISCLSINYHEDKKIGELANIFNRIQNAFSDVFFGVCFFIVPTLAEILLATFILSWLYGVLYAILLIVFLIIFTTFSIIKTNKYSFFQRIRNNVNKKADSQIIEGLINFEAIKYFVKREQHLDNCSDILTQRENAEVKAANYFFSVALIQSLIIGISLTVVLMISGVKVFNEQISIEDFIFINAYIMQFLLPLSYLGNVFRNVRKGLVDLEHFVEIFDLKPDINLNNQSNFYPKNGSIKFDKVCFSYSDRNIVLKDVSFCIPDKTTMAILGKTGSGKSTITKLLYNFYSPISGQILIDDFNTSTVSPEILSSMIAIIPQNTVIFHDTLLYNIKYHKPDTTDEEVELALKKAHLDDFISTLPDGYQTIVGEQGVKLSGGEKQRISIARAILQDPLIYIFDEPTSSLDLFTELSILKTLKEISKNKTTIIIAHRLQTLVNVDQILILDEGKVEECGTHDELLNSSSIYRKLWNINGK